jgi:hypothetical protein
MAMSAGLRFSRREHTSEGTDVIELDTKAAAPADHVTPVNVQRQFAQALPSKVGKKKVFDLTSVPPPSKAAAAADHVTPVNVKRQFAPVLPIKVGKIRLRQSDLEKADGRAKRDGVRGKTARVKAAASLRKKSAVCKAAAKNLEPIQKLRQLKHYEGKRGGQVLNLRQLQQHKCICELLLLHPSPQRKRGDQVPNLRQL